MRLTKLFGLFVFSAILALNFTSCDDDDDDNPIIKADVTGTWKYDKAALGKTVEFTEEFVEGKSEAELEVFTEEVNKMIDTKFANAIIEHEGSTLALDLDSKFVFTKGGEDAKKTEGTYQYNDKEKVIVFNYDETETLKLGLNDATTAMSYVIDISPEDLFNAGGEEEKTAYQTTEEGDTEEETTEITVEDIKSASLTLVFTKMTK